VKERLGFMTGLGAAAALVVLAVVGAWTLLGGPVLFSPGPLNAHAGVRSLGGVATHAALAHRCEACHPTPMSGQTMADLCSACHVDVAQQVASGSGLHGRLLGKLASKTCRGCHAEHHGASGALTAHDESAFPHDLTGYSLRGHVMTSQHRRFACADCHPSGVSSFDPATCSACHRSIDAAFMGRHESEFGSACLICHNGRAMNGRDFDHNKLPFKLAGKHVGVACGKCHSGGSPFKPTGQAPRTCGDCHAKDDKHKGSFGTQCGQCHSVNGWGGAKFDHSVFPVNHGNRGQSSPCQTCHPDGTATYTCYGCHEHTPGNTQAEHRRLTAAQLADCIRCHKGGRGGD